jgi:hypothetical protein
MMTIKRRMGKKRRPLATRMYFVRFARKKATRRESQKHASSITSGLISPTMRTQRQRLEARTKTTATAAAAA